MCRATNISASTTNIRRDIRPEVQLFDLVGCFPLMPQLTAQGKTSVTLGASRSCKCPAFYAANHHLHNVRVRSNRFSSPKKIPGPSKRGHHSQPLSLLEEAENGSCWAFSAVAAAEGITKLRTGKLISLSEQELVDRGTLEDQGCSGGYMDNAFGFIQKHGLTTEANYPYEASDGTCKRDEHQES
ncbi:hypothetical protein ACLOJK_015922 [Asimina triloba]